METIQIQNNKINPNGYNLVRFNDKWVLEHRLIMEFYICRPLKPEEKVHHDDFNKLNNNILNLTLFPTTKRHSHFHRQIKQFGITQPRRTELRILKEAMELERQKNLTEVIQ